MVARLRRERVTKAGGLTTQQDAFPEKHPDSVSTQTKDIAAANIPDRGAYLPLFHGPPVAAVLLLLSPRFLTNRTQERVGSRKQLPLAADSALQVNYGQTAGLYGVASRRPRPMRIVRPRTDC